MRTCVYVPGVVMAALVLGGCHSRSTPDLPTLTAAPQPVQAVPLGRLSRAQMEADLHQLAAVVKSAWAYEEDKRLHFGVDVDRLLANALGRLDRVRENEQFAGVLREFMASLQEGHAEVYAGHLAPPKPRFWPLVLRPVREGIAVAGGPSGLLKAAGVRRGDLLRSVGNRPINELIEAAARTVSASSEPARKRLALDRMGATDAHRVKLELERADGSKSHCTLDTLTTQPRQAGLPAGRFVAWQKLPGNVAYLRIPTFAWQPPQPPGSGIEELDRAMDPAKREVDAAFAAFKGTRALILDLRGNQGGSVFLASYVAEHLLPPGFVYHSGERRRSPEVLKLPDIAALPADYWGRAHVWKPSEASGVRHCAGPSHRGRLIVLIDELCFSSVDDLAACLADLHPDIRFVGRPTNGGTGEPRVIARLDNSRTDVQLCVMTVRSPKGRLIEGRGTRPHRAVVWSRADVASGTDPDLAVALAVTD